MFGFFSAETDNSVQLQGKDLLSLTRLVNSVRGVLSWCNSNGVSLNPVCNVNCITFNGLLTHSIRHKLCSELAYFKFFLVCIARSTGLVPVCSLGMQYFISIFFDLKKSMLTFEMKLFTLFALEVLQIFTVGQLLNLSTSVNDRFSPFNFFRLLSGV